ncbi:hypothetical protein [uncultured Tateyamaria sp.]|uniref:hypothetical protein n=1 Tax=uncultured Tateyamaria sp. TaxID=455651 RepID=UPI0026348B89|nr:hypothetical protein [uncultured Tateyamaria sp.]
MDKPRRFDVLSERSYRLFVIGYGISYTLYWITLLAVGWWMWETTGSAAWVGFVFFCDLFPVVLVTPWASALADRGDRFQFLKSVLWIQVGTGLAPASVAWMGLLTPGLGDGSRWLFCLGLGSSYIWTGNNIVLQNPTPEHLRSRVLGNSFMLTRAIGAISVVLTGLVIEQVGFVSGMFAVAVAVACLVPSALRVKR